MPVFKRKGNRLKEKDMIKVPRKRSPIGTAKIAAGFLYRAGAETPPKLARKIPFFPRTILEIFSAVDTRTAVWASTPEVWISAPDPQTPIFLGFWGIHS